MEVLERDSLDDGHCAIERHHQRCFPNELSVTPLPDGRYALIFQVMGLSDKVGMRIGDSPVGPFGEIREIWRTPEAGPGCFVTTPKPIRISRTGRTADQLQHDHPRFLE